MTPRSSAVPAILFLFATALHAQEAVVGWRGDGTGKYPTATPPTSWGRVGTLTQGLRFQATRPKDSDRGRPMPDGQIREWLVLGPAPECRVEDDLSADDAALAPDEGDKTGSGIWKKVTFETAWLNFVPILGEAGRRIGCAASYVYSETGGSFRLSSSQLAAVRIRLNGKPIPPGSVRAPIELAKGWNRILIKVAPRETDWACTLTLAARSPASYESKNIAWTLPLPGVTGGFYGGGTGCGSPVIVGERMYLLSEPHDLICINKEDGRVLWVRTNSYWDGAVEADRSKPGFPEAGAVAAKLNELNARLAAGPLKGPELEEKVKLEKDLYARMQEVDGVRYRKPETPDVGFSGLTPVTDGRSIYLWLGTGVTACYDLDGNRRWIRVDNLPAIEHGFSTSPILVDGKIVVFMRDLLAFHAATGELAWRIPLVSHQGANPEGYFHGTPACTSVGGVPIIALGNGPIIRASDGKILFSYPVIGKQSVSSPVVEKGLVLMTTTWSMKLYLHRLPDRIADPLNVATRMVSIDTPGYPKYYLPWYLSSPVVHDGLAYLVNNAGVLTVVDLEEGKILYQKMLDLDHFQGHNEGAARGIGVSPALAGGRLYFFGNSGASVILEPGRVFKQIARNKIENLVSVGHWGERQERFVSTPIFDGRRLYIRGEGHLYAIDERAPAATSRTDSRVAPPVPAPPVRPSKEPAPIVPDAPRKEMGAPVFGWRRDGSGIFSDAQPPLEWSATKNVKWKAAVGKGHSSPVVWNQSVFVLSEPGVLLCLNRADGSVRWKADPGENLPAEIRGSVQAMPPSRERARATPVTDGASVFVVLGDGLVARYAMDGKRAWVRFVEPPKLTYGPSASPRLVGDLLLVDSVRLTALEAATGRVRWKAAEGEPHYGSPAIVFLEGNPHAVTSTGTVVRVSDGAVLARGIADGLGGDQSPTPVVVDDLVIFAYQRCTAVKLRLEAGKVRSEKVWEGQLPGDVIGSPLLKDGMLHVIPYKTSDYRVLNARTGEVLHEKDLDADPSFYPSLAWAGKHLFLGNDQGETIVLEAAKPFRVVRRNTLPGGSGASPVFAGPHLFLRGGDHLYCIAP